MTHPWLSVIGVEADGPGGLTTVARDLLARAEIVAGSERLLAMLPEDGRPRIVWGKPFAEAIAAIAAARGRTVCVLATGDPMDYGVGARLARRFPSTEMTVVPARGAFALACARLGWSRPDVECVTVHGRPVSILQPHIQPGSRLIILSYDGDSPAAIAHLLSARGFGPSRMTVLERMGERAERRLDGIAETWSPGLIADLNTVAVECLPGPDAQVLARVPGLPDEAFRHDGQLTKREVRAMTLAALRPGPRQLLWDVGAGCGSIAIEWLRADAWTRAVAIEQSPTRAGFIRDNAVALGTPDLQVIEGKAPAALAGRDPPDAVFIGGGLDTAGLIDACWEALVSGGRLVANAVTIAGEVRLAAWQAKAGGDLRRIAIARAEAMGGTTGWRALAPVTQLALVKP